MEDPTVRARAPTVLRRTCECNRLAAKFMSDAYECLLPIVRRRCGEFRGGIGDCRPETSTPPSEADGRLCCAGGGS
jgi:hypothetical protein